jgi:hypothetical protein
MKRPLLAAAECVDPLGFVLVSLVLSVTGWHALCGRPFVVGYFCPTPRKGLIGSEGCWCLISLSRG